MRIHNQPTNQPRRVRFFYKVHSTPQCSCLLDVAFFFVVGMRGCLFGSRLFWKCNLLVTLSENGLSVVGLIVFVV
jgi:hypothetical protein